MPKGQLRFSNNLLKLGFTGIIVLFICSCTVVKNYPHNRPFVYKTNINLIGNFPNVEKDNLKFRLKQQLDDSMKPRAVSRLFWSVLKKPPVYDSANAIRSVTYMKALLISMGYFSDTINYTATIDTSDKEDGKFPTTVNFNVTPGLQTHIDSFSYNLKIPELQTLAVSTQKAALVKKGDPFAKTAISLELDRLVELYRNNGYMRFSREELIGLWDTLDISFLEPSFDPLQQLDLLQRLKERRENPTANLEITLRPGLDSSKLRKFYVGQVTVYPDISFDTTGVTPTITYVNGVKVVSYRNIFKPRIFPQNLYFFHDALYDQRNYFKTINRFNSLGAWRQVNIEQSPRGDVDTADFTIRLIPSKKYSFVANIEGSRNQNAISGNLFGIAINVGLQNRNFGRAANQANTNIRYGIETGRDTATSVKFIQSRQLSFSHVIYFPRAIPSFRWMSLAVRNSFRTVLSLNASTTDRRELYNLNNANVSWGYDFVSGKKNFTFRFPNIEYSFFQSKPKLDIIFKNSPYLRNVFTDGFISSVILGMSKPGSWNGNLNNLRLNSELSGMISGVIHSKFLDSNLYRFLKFDADFAQRIKTGKSAVFVFHFFGGIGYEFNSTVNPRKRYNLPFFREYFAGGPNSMRAWGLRKLGPGSLVANFDTTPGSRFDRYGDLQLETNLEFRFPLFKMPSVDINGAVFTDIGNIWYVKKAPDRLPEEVFNFNRLFTDLAIGVGTGLRVDFHFFVIRLDYSIKAKDPSPSLKYAAVQNKWFGYPRLRDMDQFQLAISYPFIL